MRPLLLELGRLAIERATAADLDAIRALRDVAADEAATREVRYRAIHDLLVVLADITRNRVWQMLGRRLRGLLQSSALSAARARLGRDPARFVTVIDKCLAALDAQAYRRRRRASPGSHRHAGRRPRGPRRPPEIQVAFQRSTSMSEFKLEDPDPGARLRDRDAGRLPVELRSRGRGAAEPLREGGRGAVGRGARPRLEPADRPREVRDDAARRGRADRADVVLALAAARRRDSS